MQILCATRSGSYVTILCPVKQNTWVQQQATMQGVVLLPYRTQETERIASLTFEAGCRERAENFIRHLGLLSPNLPQHEHGYINEDHLGEPSRAPLDTTTLTTSHGCHTGRNNPHLNRRGRLPPYIIPRHLEELATQEQYAPDYHGRFHRFCGRAIHHRYWAWHNERCRLDYVVPRPGNPFVARPPRQRCAHAG